MIRLALPLLRGLVAGFFRRLSRGPTLPTWGMGLDLAVSAQRSMLEHLMGLEGKGLRRVSDLPMPASPAVRRGVRQEAVDEETARGRVRGRWFRPAEGKGNGTVLFLHGGGYVVCSVDSYQELIGRLVLAGGFDVFAPEYRLAPEHPHPAAVDDALAAWRWLCRQGVAPARTAVAGDSAGGGLSAALLLRLRELEAEMPAAVGLVCPWVDLTRSCASIRSNAATDYLTPALAAHWSACYAGPHDRSEPLISPLHADLHGLPPMIIQVGGAEILRDEGQAFAEKARRAGVDVRLSLWNEMPHDWHLLRMVEARGQEAIEELASFLRGRLPVP